ncbi:MAG: hypothetical protein JJU12_05045 [Chlamydiales bacterium]|nr:hypothetical protein [Chlamydiales bacterium]
MTAILDRTGWHTAFGFHMNNWELGDEDPKIQSRVNKHILRGYIPGLGTCQALHTLKTVSDAQQKKVCTGYVRGLKLRAGLLLAPVVGPVIVAPVDLAVTAVRAYRSRSDKQN